MTIRQVLRQYDLTLQHPGHGHNDTGFSPHADTLKELDEKYVVTLRKPGVTEPEEKPAGIDPGSTILMLEAQKEGTAALTEMRKQFIDAGWSEHAAEQMVIAMMMNAGRQQ